MKQQFKSHANSTSPTETGKKSVFYFIFLLVIHLQGFVIPNLPTQ